MSSSGVAPSKMHVNAYEATKTAATRTGTAKANNTARKTPKSAPRRILLTSYALSAAYASAAARRCTPSPPEAARSNSPTSTCGKRSFRAARRPFVHGAFPPPDADAGTCVHGACLRKRSMQKPSLWRHAWNRLLQNCTKKFPRQARIELRLDAGWSHAPNAHLPLWPALPVFAARPQTAESGCRHGRAPAADAITP